MSLAAEGNRRRLTVTLTDKLAAVSREQREQLRLTASAASAVRSTEWAIEQEMVTEKYELSLA